VVQPEHKSIQVGGILNVVIGLRDPHGQPASVPSAFVVTLIVTPAEENATPTVTIPAGQSSTTLQLKPVQPGVLEIRATHPQAFEGGAFVRVSSRVTAVKYALPRALAPARLTIRDMPAPTSPVMPPAASHSPPKTAVPTKSVPSSAAEIPPVVADGAPLAPRLGLRYSPHRKILADGQDTVTIQAFLLGDDPDGPGPAEATFKVNLFASAGTLTPLPLVVQGFEGHATLTADRPGVVEVEFLGSRPSVKLEGDQRLRIHFGPPIHGLRVEAKPTSISLVDETDLIVTLLDAAGRSVATDEPCRVILALDTGRGEIAQKELTVKPGEFEAHTRFTPTGIGHVEVSAASNSLRNQIAQIDVRLPLTLLAVSVTGGLTGGLLLFLRHRRTRWTRVALGGITGFLLYWAFIFGLMRVLPHVVVLNPLSNFALSAIGGWLGTKVFEPLLDWLGLTKPRRHGEHGVEHAPEAA